ncbi:hypothetical protein ACJX0J_034340, partial [Zea mays]
VAMARCCWTTISRRSSRRNTCPPTTNQRVASRWSMASRARWRKRALASSPAPTSSPWQPRSPSNSLEGHDGGCCSAGETARRLTSRAPTTYPAHSTRSTSSKRSSETLTWTTPTSSPSK